MKNYFTSQIGRKQIMSVAGLALCGFLLMHMLGNLLLFLGPKTYNLYSHALISNPLIYGAELFLILVFVFHLVLGIILSIKNKQARPESYAQSAQGEKKTTLLQKTLPQQGVLILIFVISHLRTFKYGELYTATYEGQEVRDLFLLVKETFQDPFYVGFYILCLFILGCHLKHGIASAFKTLGFNHPRYEPTIEKLSLGFTVVVTGGFISQPLYFLFV